MSTDSYVVQPLFFPGGDIGKLAVCGTVNDLAVAGARPEFLSAGFIVREGLEMVVLERICRSMARTASRAGVSIVTGDFKVIERGEDEGVYINTTGTGAVRPGVHLGPQRVKPGDALLINGPIGQHEAAIAVARGGFGFKSGVRSDCAPLGRMIDRMLRLKGVRMMRDPTRGGLATTLNEIADATGLGFIVDEGLLPVSKTVRGIAELLGFDVMYMANEGRALTVADPARADRLVETMRADTQGRGARRIGEVVRGPAGVWLRTRFGSLRRLIMLEGEQLPRIC
jgi:hydrogenase expression/formation protein HypE